MDETNVGINESVAQSTDKEKILSGKGLEAVSNMGWKSYREELDRLTWEPIAQKQTLQIQQLKEIAKTKPPFFQSASDVLKMRKEILQYAEDSTQKYPRNGQDSYYSHKDGKKLYFTGKSMPEFGKNKTTRIYMALRDGAYRYASEILREQLTANGALEKMSFVLNLETLQGPIEPRADNNAIVMYIPDSDPDTLTKVSAAILEAKKQNPKIFELTTKQLVDAKIESTAQFMVPLDDTTWFVEVEPQMDGGLASYHSRIFAEMRKTVYSGKHPLKDGMPNIDTYKETLNSRRPEVRNSAPIIDLYTNKPLPRRLAMPALVVSK